MKKDIDRLMSKMKIDAIFAEGSSSRDATMYYLFNGINITGIYVKKRGRPAYVIHSSIEREEAQKTGLKAINYNRYELKKIYDKYENSIKANAVFTKRILDDLKIKGKIAFYSKGSIGTGYNYLQQLLKLDKKITIAYEPKKSLITIARETKDEDEVQRIKKAGSKVAKAFNFLIQTVRSMKVKNNVIMRGRGKKLLIGDLKVILRKKLYEQGVVNSAGLIVAQGRDAGVPHNSGKDREAVKIGKTIVFDIYPQELDGGYFFDFTRTICFGFAPPNIAEVYRIVRDAQDFAIEKMKVGKRTIDIEKILCKFFEKKGHRTLLTDSNIQVGYCHSLGHGLGLSVHESPTFGLAKTNKNRIKPGQVFTVEPGLYYPDQGFGIRLEDVVYVNKKGKIINLTNYPRNLVVEL
jgi:Xaa-Pro aminopeptidase